MTLGSDSPTFRAILLEINTGVVPELKFWHLYWPIPVHSVGDLNSQMNETQLQTSRVIHWMTSARQRSTKMCISARSTITGAKGVKHVAVLTVCVFYNNSFTEPCGALCCLHLTTLFIVVTNNNAEEFVITFYDYVHVGILACEDVCAGSSISFSMEWRCWQLVCEFISVCVQSAGCTRASCHVQGSQCPEYKNCGHLRCDAVFTGRYATRRFRLKNQAFKPQNGDVKLLPLYGSKKYAIPTDLSLNMY